MLAYGVCFEEQARSTRHTHVLAWIETSCIFFTITPSDTVPFDSE